MIDKDLQNVKLIDPNSTHTSPTHPQPAAAPPQPPQMAQQVTIVQPPPPPPIPTFDGSQDVFEFLECFDSAALSCRWQDDTQASYLQSYLRGDARKLYNSLSQQDRNDIGMLKDSLIRNFSPNTDEYFDMFNERRPKLNEKPRSFALALQELFNRAMPTADRDHRNSLLIRKFRSYLPQSLQMMVKLTNVQTWDALVNAADTAMECFGPDEAYHDKTPAVNRIETTHQQSQRPPLPKPRRQHQQEAPRPPPRRLQCHNCSGYGHMQRECPSPRQNSRAPQPQPRNANRHQQRQSNHYFAPNRPQYSPYHPQQPSYRPYDHRRQQAPHESHHRPQYVPPSPHRAEIPEPPPRQPQQRAYQPANVHTTTAETTQDHYYHHTLPIQSDPPPQSAPVDQQRPYRDYSINTMAVNSSYHSLPRYNVKYSIANFSFNLATLFDTGCTHSFISSKHLPPELQQTVAAFAKNPSLPQPLGLRIHHLRIETVNDAHFSTCVEIPLTTNINGFMTTFSFFFFFLSPIPSTPNAPSSA